MGGACIKIFVLYVDCLGGIAGHTTIGIDSSNNAA